MFCAWTQPSAQLTVHFELLIIVSTEVPSARSSSAVLSEIIFAISSACIESVSALFTAFESAATRDSGLIFSLIGIEKKKNRLTFKYTNSILYITRVYYMLQVEVSVGPRREREKEGRKNLIVDTAEKVFSEKGYDQATMDEIALAAEFTKKSVYSYFPAKDELFSAVVLRAAATLEALFSEAVDSGETGFDKVTAIGNAYVRFYNEFPAQFKILSIKHQGSSLKNGPTRDEIEQHGSGIFTLMVQSFSIGQKDGTIRKDIDPTMAALHVMSVSNGILELVTEARGHFTERFGMSAQDFIHHSLRLIGDSIKIQKK